MSCAKRLLYSSSKFVVELDPYPFSPGTVYVNVKKGDGSTKAITVLDLSVEKFVDLLLLAQKVSHKLCEKLKVQRCAMVASPNCNNTPPGVRIIPLHGLKAEWNAMLSGEPEYYETFQGYISSNNGPKIAETKLDDLRKQIRDQLHETDDKEESDIFYGDHLKDKIKIPQWRVWEDKNHIAFLTPYPNTPGFTVVIPRKHLSSDIFSLKKDDYIALLKASHYVSQLLCKGIPNACACGIIFEGFEIDYAHAKLIPIIGDFNIKSNDTNFCEEYKGFVNSKDGKKLSEVEMEEMTTKLDFNDL